MGIEGRWKFLDIIMMPIFIDGKTEAHRGQVTLIMTSHNVAELRLAHLTVLLCHAMERRKCHTSEYVTTAL